LQDGIGRKDALLSHPDDKKGICDCHASFSLQGYLL
jgi:hypothetical protein